MEYKHNSISAYLGTLKSQVEAQKEKYKNNELESERDWRGSFIKLYIGNLENKRNSLLVWVVYGYFLSRYQLSKFKDKENKKYFTCNIENICSELKKSRPSIIEAIKELEKLNYLKVKKTQLKKAVSLPLF